MVVAAVVPAHSEDLSMPHQPLRLPACVPIAHITARVPSSEGMTHVGRRYRHNAYTSVQPRERRINRWQIASRLLAAAGLVTLWGAAGLAVSGRLGGVEHHQRPGCREPHRRYHRRRRPLFQPPQRRLAHFSPINERSPSCQPVSRSAVSRVASHPTCVRHAPA